MKHEINLENCPIRTDLALEILENSKIKKEYSKKTTKYKDIIITDIFLDKESGKIVGKKEGRYITLSFDDVTDSDNQKDLLYTFKKSINSIMPKIKKEDLVAIIGIGNIKSTPDSLGPRTVSNITVTNHLYEMGVCSNNYQRVATIIPGVIGETGINTFVKIKTILKEIKPKLVIVIDALASGSINHVNKTIQITNTGIEPGSGIGNKSDELSFSSLGIPVIAIGIPTVVDAVNIVGDTINYMYRQFSFSKNNINKAKYRFTYGNINYLKEDIKIDALDKEKYFGLIGRLNDFELKKLLDEVLTPIGYNLMVTPKEIDFILGILTKILSDGLNEIFAKAS